jgi:hypothetical protein
MPSLTKRYLHALFSRPQGPRPRTGYSLGQRYWASLTGVGLTPRPEQPASARLQVRRSQARQHRVIFSGSSAPGPAAQTGRPNRLMMTGFTTATAVLAAIGIAVGVFGATLAHHAASPPAGTVVTGAAPGASPDPAPDPDPGPPTSGFIELPLGYSAVYVLARPSLNSPVVREVTNDTAIEIFCTALGSLVTNSVTGAISDLWDYISDGYIPSVFVDTETSQAAIRSC